MNILTKDSVTSLLEKQTGEVVSLYLPTHRLQILLTLREDQTRFKNLINIMRKKMEASGLDEDNIQSYAKFLEDTLDNADIWMQMTEGMAVFVNEQGVKIYKLPMECEERVTIGTLFDVTPLLVLRGIDQPYYLLALAVHQPRLYKGTVYGLEPAMIELPESPEKALNIDELFSSSNTIRSSSTLKGSRERISFQGQGDPREAGNEERLKFFRVVDETILDSNEHDETLPFLIAGTGSEVAEYRDISKINTILDAQIDGNHTKTQLSELHAMAWPIIEREVEGKKRLELIKRYNDLVGSKKASYEIQSIRDAADSGRVDTLLVGIRTTTQDTVRDTAQNDQEAISKIVFPPAYDEQRLNECAIKVVGRGGEVVGMDIDEMPERSIVAALYRY